MAASLMSAESTAGTPRLPRSGLEVRDGVLTRAFGETVLARHDLRQAESLRFERGLHSGSLKLAAAPLAAAVACGLLVSPAWLSWALSGLFVLLALPIVRGAWGETLCFESGGREIRLPLVGTPEEIAEFHAALSAAVAPSRDRGPNPAAAAADEG